MRYEIRSVEPAEWRESRELRLTALRDPVAPVAFARTYAEESVMTDDQWRFRASGEGAQQFVAVRTVVVARDDADADDEDDVDHEDDADDIDDDEDVDDGDDETDDHVPQTVEQWVGMTVVVMERPDYHSINAVYLTPEVRGSGVAAKLLAAAIAWAWERTDRLYLWVHEKNPRAQAFYRRLGFVPTGRTMASPLDAGLTEFEWVLVRGGGHG